MKKFFSCLAVGVFCLFTPAFAATTTFDASWDNGFGEPPVARMTGVLTVNGGAGDTFGLGDVVSLSFAVSSKSLTAEGTTTTFTLDNVHRLGGVIAADGFSATFTDIWMTKAFDGLTNDDSAYFGCVNFSGCEQFDFPFTAGIAASAEGSLGWLTDGENKGDALASISLTTQVQPIPLPATLPMLAIALGWLALRRRAA